MFIFHHYRATLLKPPKSQFARELQAEFERRRLSEHFTEQNKVSIELTEAVPPTETLNVEAQRSRAELARQGSLADRNPPAGLAQVRTKQQQPSAEPDVTFDDGEPVPDGYDANNSPVSCE